MGTFVPTSGIQVPKGAEIIHLQNLTRINRVYSEFTRIYRQYVATEKRDAEPVSLLKNKIKKGVDKSTPKGV